MHRESAPHSNNSDSTTRSVLLSAASLSCARGENTLFTELDLSVADGQCLHIIGANGSGKTSLLRILCGISQADSGQVLWRGTDTKTSELFFAESAYIGHKDGLKNELTAFENLAFNQRLDGKADEDRLDDCLAQLKILHCADLPAQVLSFGQRRRLAFAKLLLTPKTLWILDEPFTGIDIEGRKLIEQLCVQHLSHGGAIAMTHHQSLNNSQLSDYRTELHLDNDRKGQTVEADT